MCVAKGKAARDDEHDGLNHHAQQADLARGMLEGTAGQDGLDAAHDFPQDNEGEDGGGGALALDHPVRRRVDDLADPNARAAASVRRSTPRAPRRASAPARASWLDYDAESAALIANGEEAVT